MAFQFVYSSVSLVGHFKGAEKLNVESFPLDGVNILFHNTLVISSCIKSDG